MDKRNRKNAHLTILVCLILLAATLLVYFQVFNNDFVYDDIGYISKNPNVQRGFNSESISWAFTTSYAGHWHPLTWLSHMLDCRLFGLNPRGHHLSNLIFHMANSLILFLVLLKMTGALWRSAVVAIIFAIHPLNIESVAWVSERKNVLSTLFWLLTIWAYWRYVQCQGISRYAIVILFFVLGLLSKAMLVTLPLVLLLLDYWPLDRFNHGNNRRNTVILLVREKVPLLIISAASSTAAFLSIKDTGTMQSLDMLPLTIRLANALVSYMSYIWKMIWPINLAVFYPHPGDTLNMWHALGAFMIIVVVTILTLGAARSRKYLAVGCIGHFIFSLSQIPPDLSADVK